MNKLEVIEVETTPVGPMYWLTVEQVRKEIKRLTAIHDNMISDIHKNSRFKFTKIITSWAIHTTLKRDALQDIKHMGFTARCSYLGISRDHISRIDVHDDGCVYCWVQCDRIRRIDADILKLYDILDAHGTNKEKCQEAYNEH